MKLSGEGKRLFLDWKPAQFSRSLRSLPAMNDVDLPSTQAAKKYLPFIPVWLDDAKLTPFEFRVLAHLYRRRNHRTGQCNPAVEVFDDKGVRSGITVTCRMNRKTVFQALRQLENAGWIKRDGKPFGGSNNYLLLSPAIVPPDGTIEAPQSSHGTGHQSSPQTGHQPSHGAGHQSSRQTGQEGITKEGITNEGITIEGMGPTVDDLKIFEAYPKRVGKVEALKAIAEARKTVPVAKLLTAVMAYSSAVADWPEDDRQYVPHPAKWFSTGRYDDDPKTWVRTPKNNNRIGRTTDAQYRKGF
jgi:DNA-binding MarR family transcriptional regulator